MLDYELVSELCIEKTDGHINKNGGPYHETISRMIHHTQLWKHVAQHCQTHVIRDACIVHIECCGTQECVL